VEVKQRLFEQSVKDLSPEQGSKVKHLLQTFSHIFAKDDADFGRTSIIKHEIEVQNARPVKEPPRRVPYHLQGALAKICENVCKRCFTLEPCSGDRSLTDCSNKYFK
jgi:hypothetical protein